jgi:hypothetical protein
MPKLSCFICLDTLSGMQNILRVQNTHLKSQHGFGWDSLVRTTLLHRIACCHWRFKFVSQCLALLKSSLTKEAYLTGVASLVSFNPAVYPPGYSEDESMSQKNKTGALWRNEYEQVAIEWIAYQKAHPFSGMSCFPNNLT